MAEARDLWWEAGRLAFEVSSSEWSNRLWHASLRRAALLLEPVWPKDGGGCFQYALPTVAMLLYTKRFNGLPAEAPVETIVEVLASREPGMALEDVIRSGLTERGHDLDDGSRFSALFRRLTAYQEPMTCSSSGMELPSIDQWPGGTLMDAAAKWAVHRLTYHYLDTSAQSA